MALTGSNHPRHNISTDALCTCHPTAKIRNQINLSAVKRTVSITPEPEIIVNIKQAPKRTLPTNHPLDNSVRAPSLNSPRELIGRFSLNFTHINNITVLIEVASKMINWTISLSHSSFQKSSEIINSIII